MCQNIIMQRLGGGTQTLVDKLRAIQLREQASDKGMAQRLGCSRQLYQMARSGKIPPGNKILKGISATFPELQQDVIYFLANNADKSSRPATRNPLVALFFKAQGGLKRFFVELLGRIRK